MKKVLVIDYGMGNTQSVLGALNYLGVDCLLTSDPREVAKSDTLLLPGVGSFRLAMERLIATGLAESIAEAVLCRNRKILGICLGMQLLASYGDEDGGSAGLNFFPGNVVRIPAQEGLKVPHVGFNSVCFEAGSYLGRDIATVADFYFVHSYRLELQDRPGMTGTCDYGDEFVACYEHENVFATQFHPEKSQTNGLQLLSNFLSA